CCCMLGPELAGVLLYDQREGDELLVEVPIVVVQVLVDRYQPAAAPEGRADRPYVNPPDLSAAIASEGLVPGAARSELDPVVVQGVHGAEASHIDRLEHSFE